MGLLAAWGGGSWNDALRPVQIDGGELAADLGCGACHAGLPTPDRARERAPTLGNAGPPIPTDFVFTYLAAPERRRDNIGLTRMPDFSLDEANRYMIDYVPYMEQDLGRYDLEGYLRRPGSGSGYIIGKIQLEKLLSERALALGSDFDLGAFHDDVLSRGMIPLTLIRWEMTGADDEVARLWREATGAELR